MTEERKPLIKYLLREFLGEKVDANAFLAYNNRKQNGYWKDWNNVEETFRNLIVQLGHFPNQTELLRLKQYGLIQAVGSHGGVAKVRKKISPIYSKDKDKNKFKRDVLRETIKIMKKYNLHEPPSERVLNKLGHSSLFYRIGKYYGGISRFREEFARALDRPSEGQELTSLLEEYANNSSQENN